VKIEQKYVSWKFAGLPLDEEFSLVHFLFFAKHLQKMRHLPTQEQLPYSKDTKLQVLKNQERLLKHFKLIIDLYSPLTKQKHLN
jgi:hypothetical protein